MTVAPAPHLRRAGPVVVMASLLAIALATLLPQSGSTVQSHFCLICGSFGTVDAILNILLFVPLGVGLALSGFGGKRAILGMLALSVMIETAQFFVIQGRDSTIGDIVTNTIGGALGFMLVRHARSWLMPSPRIGRRLVGTWACIWLAIQIISTFGFALSLPSSQYYGQIARSLGGFETFPGLVRSARIGPVEIPNTVIADSRGIERLLADGSPVTATVMPAALTRDIAPILRVADGRQREIVMLAEDGEKLVFGIHTGAAVLRLRSPLFALSHVFPGGRSSISRPGDSTRLTSQHVGSDVRMFTSSADGPNDRRIPVTSSLGWTLWLPFRWLIEGTRTERVISAVWLACLMVPIGYWSGWIRGSSRSRDARWQSGFAVLMIVAVAFVGLVVMPHAFGVRSAGVGGWVATLCGFLFGYALGTRKPERIAAGAESAERH